VDAEQQFALHGDDGLQGCFVIGDKATQQADIDQALFLAHNV